MVRSHYLFVSTQFAFFQLSKIFDKDQFLSSLAVNQLYELSHVPQIQQIRAANSSLNTVRFPHSRRAQFDQAQVRPLHSGTGDLNTGCQGVLELMKD